MATMACGRFQSVGVALVRSCSNICRVEDAARGSVCAEQISAMETSRQIVADRISGRSATLPEHSDSGGPANTECPGGVTAGGSQQLRVPEPREQGTQEQQGQQSKRCDDESRREGKDKPPGTEKGCGDDIAPARKQDYCRAVRGACSGGPKERAEPPANGRHPVEPQWYTSVGRLLVGSSFQNLKWIV